MNLPLEEKVDPDDFFGKVPIVKTYKDADDPADKDKIIF